MEEKKKENLRTLGTAAAILLGTIIICNGPCDSDRAPKRKPSRTVKYEPPKEEKKWTHKSSCKEPEGTNPSRDLAELLCEMGEDGLIEVEETAYGRRIEFVLGSKQTIARGLYVTGGIDKKNLVNMHKVTLIDRGNKGPSCDDTLKILEIYRIRSGDNLDYFGGFFGDRWNELVENEMTRKMMAAIRRMEKNPENIPIILEKMYKEAEGDKAGDVVKKRRMTKVDAGLKGRFTHHRETWLDYRPTIDYFSRRLRAYQRMKR